MNPQKVTVKDVAAALEAFAPRQYAEGFDNTGLLVGEPDTEVTGILVAHDCLEEVVAEAQAKGCNLIVAFHPIIFSGRKRLTGRNAPSCVPCGPGSPSMRSIPRWTILSTG